VTWHADPTTLARYAGGAADAVTAASVEAHLTGCAECRAALAPYADPARTDATWHAVVGALDAPRPTLAERALRAAGVREDRARLLAATPSLRTSWLLSVLVVMTFAVLAGQAGGGDVFFLLVAPLVPVAGVAAAFGPGVDAAYELAVAAPYGGVRLLLLRTVAVLAFSLAVLGAAGVAVPGLTGAEWLLPALGLSAATLALSTRATPAVAAGAVAFCWIGYALLPGWDPAGGRAQAACALLLVLGVAVLATGPDSLERGERA
jgi:predicted anti-sigma-YlaC factor YlaD